MRGLGSYPVMSESPTLTDYNPARLALEKYYKVILDARSAGAFEPTYCQSSGENPPWIAMPPEGRRMSYVNSIVLPAEGVESDVTTFRVPLGYDGVITQHFQLFAPSGLGAFTEGSGDIAWRIRQNTRPVQGYHNMLFTAGDLRSPLVMEAGGIRIWSGQELRYTVTLAAGSLARLLAGRIICGLIGWIYPSS